MTDPFPGPSSEGPAKAAAATPGEGAPAEAARSADRRIPDAGTRKAHKTEKKPLPVWQESILLLGIALVLAIGIKYFFIQAFYIPSPSMEPLFVKDDRILVQKVSYWFGGEPQRGDVVVFSDPGGWLNEGEGSSATNPVTKGLEAIGLYPSGGHLVKRVIGVGGDHVSCDPTKGDGKLTVNGTALDEKSYLPDGVSPCGEPFDVNVPEGHLWLMGDNRGDSADSRAHMNEPGKGFVSTDRVVGKVWALIWPWGHARWIPTPKTFEDIPKP